MLAVYQKRFKIIKQKEYRMNAIYEYADDILQKVDTFLVGDNTINEEDEIDFKNHFEKINITKDKIINDLERNVNRGFRLDDIHRKIESNIDYHYNHLVRN